MADNKKEGFSKLTKSAMQTEINKATGLKLSALDRANAYDIVKLAQYLTSKGVKIEGVK